MNAHHKPLKIGLIGTGFMGKTHVYGYAIADRVFDLPYKLELVSVADVSEDLAQSAAHSLGFKRATSNWLDLIDDRDLDLISITSPNEFHKEMAIAALEAGKHVLRVPPPFCLFFIGLFSCLRRNCVAFLRKNSFPHCFHSLFDPLFDFFC